MGDPLGTWLAQLRKGVAELFVLRLLETGGALHGYAVTQKLHELGDVVAGESTVYPLLRRLEREGLVVAEWSTEGGGNPRKYYKITRRGSEFLHQALEEWHTLMGSMDEMGSGEQR